MLVCGMLKHWGKILFFGRPGTYSAPGWFMSVKETDIGVLRDGRLKGQPAEDFWTEAMTGQLR